MRDYGTSMPVNVCMCVHVQGSKEKPRKGSTMHYQYEKPHNFKVLYSVPVL